MKLLKNIKKYDILYIVKQKGKNMEEVIYFEFNEWESEYYPDEEPYKSQICMQKENNYYINFKDKR